MRLLLAEKEVEEGNPRQAIRLLEDLSPIKDTWIYVHSRVILAEALLGEARNNPERKREFLDAADELLKRLGPDGISDTPDRILPRAFAAQGEIELLRGHLTPARTYFRKAMNELDQKSPTTWGRHYDVPGSQFTPDYVQHDTYWRRPWRRNWTRVAELCLMVELADLEDEETAFIQLQRYRTVTHSGTIAELAGFVPEASLSSAQYSFLEGRRGKARQLEILIGHMRAETVQLKAAIDPITCNDPNLPELHQRLETVLRQLEDTEEELRKCKEEIRSVENEVDDTRGYLSNAASIRRPEKHEIEYHLDLADAAVVELIRLDGTLWSLPKNWYAFVVTRGGVRVVQLSGDGEDDIDRELRLLRSNRERLDRTSLRTLSALIVRRLPLSVFSYRNLFIAADGDAWAVPFRSLVRPRWWFVPRRLADSEFYANWPVPEAVKRWMDSLVIRLDSGIVTNIISTTHLIRLLELSRERRQCLGVVVGSSGDSEARILCQGLAKSLEVHPPTGQEGGIRWKRYPGTLEESTRKSSYRLEWMDGTSQAFMASWHTTFTGDPNSVAVFHFDDGEMTLAEFLSQTRHESDLAIILSCNISHPPDDDFRTFHRIGSAAFGIMEALQANAIVSTTNEVTAEVAFVLGRFLSTELSRSSDLHTALAKSQKQLRECKVADVISMLKELENKVPETTEWLRRLNSADPSSLAFPKACDTEPFYILGLPGVRISEFN